MPFLENKNYRSNNDELFPPIHTDAKQIDHELITKVDLLGVTMNSKLRWDDYISLARE